MSYTLAVTSCNRHDLLKQSLLSFYLATDELPQETIIYEDGPTPMPEWLHESPSVRWIQGGERKGQLHAIDTLYGEVKTAEIFHLKDDWLFLPAARRSRFIYRSRQILDKWPFVLMVSLRGKTGWHPLVQRAMFPFLIAQPNWDGWGGLAWNPGLRRKSDWENIGSYSQHAVHSAGAEHERQLSIMYQKMGYMIADLGEELVRHLGDGRSILDDFVKGVGRTQVVPAT